ncbi:MAG: ketoacyl-ACP synthase III [Methylacidiphilales bacterium]|nr:ketoacyl-ACP synthase III [Candidatus Methylacidiphilales bacterium]
MTNLSKTPKSTGSARRSASIISTGAYLPSRILSNADLEKMVDTTDEWILSRTGIRERRIAAEDEFTSDMGASAARQALELGGINPLDLDLIIVATCTGDTVFPSTACYIQNKIGATRAAAFDVQAACSGFLYALVTAEQFIVAGAYKTILVVGAEKLSSIVNWQDRNTCVLFGDGAGAVILQNRPGSRGLLAYDLGADGAQTGILSVPASGCRIPMTPEVLDQRLHLLQMAGKEVFKYAVNAMNRSAEDCLEKAGVKPDQVRWFIPHQANFRIVDAVAQRMNVGMEHFVMNLDRYGNTSSACMPIALHETNMAGKLNRGDLVLMVSFGGGLTWASVVLEW